MLGHKSCVKVSLIVNQGFKSYFSPDRSLAPLVPMKFHGSLANSLLGMDNASNFVNLRPRNTIAIR